MSEPKVTATGLFEARRAAAFMALVADREDRDSYLTFMDDLSAADLAVTLTVVARWFATELTDRFARERCLGRDEARQEVIAYMVRMARMLTERLDQREAEARVLAVLDAEMEQETRQ